MSPVVELPAALAPVVHADTVASVAQPTPGPTPSREFEDFEVSPGLLGFLPPFLIALACVGLFLSLTRQLRKVSVRQAQLDAREAEAARGSAATESGATGTAGGDGLGDGLSDGPDGLGDGPDGLSDGPDGLGDGPDGARGPGERRDRPGPR